MRDVAQLSPYLRSVHGGHGHWCPGCGEMHVIPMGWYFDGNLERPTFEPSVRITGKQRVIIDGRWTGEWVRDANGAPVDLCCHYILADGQLQFCADSTHRFSGRMIPLPPLPP